MSRRSPDDHEEIFGSDEDRSLESEDSVITFPLPFDSDSETFDNGFYWQRELLHGNFEKDSVYVKYDPPLEAKPLPFHGRPGELSTSTSIDSEQGLDLLSDEEQTTPKREYVKKGLYFSDEENVNLPQYPQRFDFDTQDLYSFESPKDLFGDIDIDTVLPEFIPVDDFVNVPNEAFRSEEVKFSDEVFEVPKKKRRRRKHSKAVPEEINPVRMWAIKVCPDNMVDKVDFKITTKSRLEAPVELVSERLYSSIQYQMLFEVSAPFVPLAYSNGHSVVIGRVHLHDYVTGEILGGCWDAKTTSECTVKRVGETEITGKFKAKFMKNLSFHNTQKEYYYSVDIYVQGNLRTPYLSIVSPGFKIYSRKPNNRKKKTKRKSKVVKRKRKPDSNDEGVPKKKIKVMDLFHRQLNDLIESFKKLPKGVKVNAGRMMSKRINDVKDGFCY